MPTAKKTSKKTGKRTPRKQATANTPPQAQRLKNLRAAIAEHPGGGDKLIVSNPSDVAYLTGFFGGDSVLIVPARGKPIVISDRRYEEDLEPVKPLARIVMRKGPMPDAIGDLLKDRGDSAVLLQPEHITRQDAEVLAKRLGRRTLRDAPGIVSRLREIKDAGEIRAIRAAIRVQEAAMLATLEQIGPGMTELEAAAILEYEMMARGASGPAFHTIVAARANGSRPHYAPSTTKLARNQPLLIDWGAVVEGYRGDMTRVFCFGRWPKAIREIYAVVLEAHQHAADAIAPGVTNHQLDAIARDHITAAGYGPKFGHSLGHGIGIDTHEKPGLSQQGTPVEIKPGMVVTIEPGIYLPGVGGVRIEDDYAVTERGRTNLSSLPKDLDFASLG